MNKTATTISDLLNEAERGGVMVKNGRQSLKWYAKKVKGIKTDHSDFIRGQTSDRYRNSNQVKIGAMYCFMYDAKHKAKLPYYDSFPCIFLINVYPAKKAFLGLNLHYLPYRQRAILLDELYKIENNSKLPMSKKLTLSWEILKNFAHFALVQPCVKMYLGDHIRSKVIQIPYEEWNIVAMLPVSKFQKASALTVWNDSLKKGKK